METLPLNQLHVIVKSRTRVLFDGNALAVTSVNEKGTFDVLGQHANFISLIKDKIIVHRIDNTSQSFPLTSGVIKVRENLVQVYLGIVQSGLI